VPRAWREPERIGGAVRRQLARFGDSGRLGDVLSAWPEAVGALVARNAWPARIARDGTLVVHTKDAVWAFELGHRAEEIRLRLGLELKALKFVPGPVPEGTHEPAKASRKPPTAPTAEQSRRAAELTAEIADEGLRERVAKAAAASLASVADGRSVW
jgi:hypothetical protein